jgi:hypothetical protein
MRLQNFGTLIICRCLGPMLASIDLDDESLGMAGEVHDVTIDLNLSTKMGSLDPQAMTQMPPQSALCIRRRSSHLPCELAMPQRFLCSTS